MEGDSIDVCSCGYHYLHLSRYLLDGKCRHMLHSKTFNNIAKKGGARPMVMSKTTIFTELHSIQKGAVGFIPCRSAPAAR